MKLQRAEENALAEPEKRDVVRVDLSNRGGVFIDAPIEQVLERLNSHKMVHLGDGWVNPAQVVAVYTLQLATEREFPIDGV